MKQALILQAVGLISVLFLGCSSPRNEKSDADFKTQSMVTTIEALHAMNSVEKVISEARYFVTISMVPESLGSYWTGSRGGFKGEVPYAYEIMSSQIVLDTATITQVLYVLNHPAECSMHVYYWRERKWIEDVDLAEQLYPGTKRSTQELLERWKNSPSPTTIPVR